MNTIHSSQSRTALVIGAGVAGLTASACLRRQGWEVTVVERAPSLRTGGYKVDARGAGVEVLRRLGVLADARRMACGVSAGSIVTADGRTVAAMGGDTFGGRTGEDAEIERGDLIGLLATVAGPVAFDTTVTAIADGADGVRVTFADGTTHTYDVVLGADGLNSATRQLALDTGSDGSAVRHLGHGIAVVTMHDSLGLSAEEMTYVAPGTTALLYATATRPRARAMLLFTHEGGLPRERSAQVAFLRERFAGQGWRVPEVLDALATADDVYLDSVAQVELPAWSRGAMGLLGDAACCASPASGQGTTLGLVTAYVTSAELARTPDDIPGALRRAEASLRPFARANQKLGPANLKRMVLPSERAVRSTLRALRVLTALPLERLVLGAVARKLHRASAFDLPELVSPRAG